MNTEAYKNLKEAKSYVKTDLLILLHKNSVDLKLFQLGIFIHNHQREPALENFYRYSMNQASVSV